MSKKEDRKKFVDSLKATIDYSKIDYSKFINNNESDDEERVRERTDDSRYKNDNPINFSEVPSGFNTEQLTGKNISQLIEKTIDLEAQRLDIEAPNYQFYNNENDKFVGYYEDNTVYINTAKPIKTDDTLESYNNYMNLMATVIHETRHKCQDEAMAHPEKYPEMNQTIVDYLKDSDENYPTEGETDYWNKYYSNGLESDAENYARGRLSIYSEHSLDEILNMNEAPEVVQTNQILMDSGDVSIQGVRAPVTVASGFDQFASNSNSSKKSSHYSRQGGGSSIMEKGTDLSPQAQKAAADAYMQVVHSIEKYSNDIINTFRNRLKANYYKQLQNLLNCFVQYHNEELPNEIVSAINSWKESSNSFSNMLMELGEDSGSKSVSEAKKLENELENTVRRGFKQIPKVEVNGIIRINKDIILSDAEVAEDYLGELRGMRANYTEQFLKLGENDNEIYAKMAQMVVDTFTNVEGLYSASIDDFNNLANEYAGSRETNVDRGHQNATSAASKNRKKTSAFSGRRTKGI
ncbi:MAG: hypothetical protein LUH02_03465 [Erysipelotrichaceae bacterium]|nr:hypothetical protein [Erysipelotrichaceae bacterium]